MLDGTGSGQTYTNGSSTPLSFHCNGNDQKYTGIKVDGNDATKYATVTYGSTIVTLNTSYLNTLAAGSHTLTIEYEKYTSTSNKSIESTFAVSGTTARQEMYRLYNPNSGEHFYTANASERDNLASLGWKYEGLGWTAPVSSNTPVYRMYNPNAGEHHYTMDAKERDNLVKVGWKYEGIGWYSDDAKTVPVYREYNPNAFSCNHNYTPDKKENDWLVSLGWRAEGIGWYGM